MRLRAAAAASAPRRIVRNGGAGRTAGAAAPRTVVGRGANGDHGERPGRRRWRPPGGPRVTATVPPVLLAGLAAAGPHLVRWRWNAVDVTAFAAPPSARHWLGTTPTGRDVCALTLRGMRTSLLVGVSAALVATTLAGLAGAVAGHLGGWADRALTRAGDLSLVFPPFLVAAVLSASLRRGGGPALAALLAGLMWPVTARAVRAAAASLRGSGYVLAARQMGRSPLVIVLRHVLPNVAAPLAADAALNTGAAIGAETGLSFLGLGVRPPDVSLGTLIADGAPAATVFPWLFLPPVGALVAIVLAVHGAGTGLRAAGRPARDGGPG